METSGMLALAMRVLITTLVAALFAALAAIAWLAARGPWEDGALMGELTPLRGGLFTWLMDRVIEHGAVSGNCFPSAHVAGAWAIVVGLAGAGWRRAAVWCVALLAAGVTLACVYTRYHHAVDIAAGLVVTTIPERSIEMTPIVALRSIFSM